MSKLLRANLVRLWKNKVFWIGFLLLTTFGAGQRVGLSMDVEAHYLDETFWIDALLIGIILSAFISLFVGTEFEDGTIRNKIVMGHSRSEIYFANVTVCIFAGWLMCLGCLISSLLAGIPLLGFFHTEISIILLEGICVFALSAAYAAIFNLIAMLSHNRAVTAIICISLAMLFLFFGTAISNKLKQGEGFYIPDHELGQYEIADEQNAEWVSNPNYLEGTERRIYEIAFNILPGGQSLQLSGMVDGSQNYIEMFIASLAWIALSCGCGLILFRKKDLK